MVTITRFVGLDYHQDSVQVCVMNAEGETLGNRSVPNSWQCIRAVVGGTVSPDEPATAIAVQAGIECCSGAAHLSEELIERAGWSVTLAHAGIVRRMKQNPEKSDWADAHILADLMRLGYLPRVWLAPQEIRQLRSLVRFRYQLVKQQTRLKLRIRALLREHRIAKPEGIGAWSLMWFAWLSRLELDEVTRFLMDQHVEELQRLRGKIVEVEKLLFDRTGNDALIAKLLKLDGIGPITAITMRAEIARFERFDTGKQLARYYGLTPRNASSGQRQADAGLVKAGNTQLRMVIIQAAQRLINFDPYWNRFACRLMQRGKPRNVAVAAVANRWIRRLYHQMQPEQLVTA